MAFEGYNGSTYDRSITENKRKSNEQKLASGQYADTHTPGKLASNVDSVLSNAQFVKDDTKVSFGSKEYDKEAFNLAAEAQRNWWENTGSKGKQYGYDMTDPEDVQRASEGRYSVAYEKSYGDDEYSQWLLANGQASQGFFESKYYKEAYNSVMLNRAEQERVKNFKKAVAQEAWSTASDTMNISGDDIAAAAQRVQIKNPQFAGIAITNTKETSGSDFSDYFSPMLAEQTAAEKEADKRATSLYLDEVADIISSYQEKQRHTNQKATEAAERNANEAQSIIDIAIKNSGYSEEIDGRVGLAKDSTLDEWNANKELKRKAATDAVGAMEVAGMSKSEIKQAIRQDGRLSYIEDSEQGIQDETTRIQRRDASDAVASDILMREAPIVQASVARAKSLANMGTAAQAGFSPISMMEGYGLSDVESAYVEKYMSDTRLALEMSGYDGLEIDNAFRRADLGEYIPKETARANYAVYTLNEMGCSNEQIEAILGSWGEEDWAAIDKDMSISDYVEDSTIDIASKAIISVPIRAALSIISGAVGFADMVGGTISGRTETWELTDRINEQAAWWSAYSHDRNHEMISEAADIGSEMLRMYATAMMGTGLAAASTKLMSTAKGTGFLFNFISKNANRIPFVTGAIGNYYTEAMNEGTTSRQAAVYAIPAGLLEGYLESLEMGQVMRNTFGVNFVGKKIAASGLSTNFKQFAITKGMPFINFALDVIGEGAEESLSAIGSSMLRTATWDEEHQLNMTDVWQNAKGGLILGAVMGGLSMGANTQSYKYASEIYKNTGDYSKYIDSLQSAMHIENMDESKRTAILDNVETTEVTDADREAFISATAEIHNLTENIAAKKAAVEAAEQDVAVKVENAEQEVAELKKRISVLQENNGKKKADKIKELAARLNSKQKSLEQIKSEGAKKVETAIADYKAVASKANATIAKNQELIDKYHAAKYTADLEETIANYQAAKYFTDFYGIPQKPAQNAPVDGRVAMPITNTTDTANVAQNPIDTVKTETVEVTPEPALKDLGANTPTPVEMKTRKSYSNTFDKAMSAVSNAVSKVSGTYYNEGSYAVSKEKDTLAYAQEAVRGELENAGTLAGLETRLSSREAWTAEDVDTAMIMAEVYEQEALETGDFTKLENLKRIIGEHLTEAGQVVQAMAKWSRTTNAGASVWVERTINKLNEKNADKIANGKATKITIPDDLKAKLAAAKTKEERDSILAETSAVIGQQIPPDAKSILDSIRYLSMLGNVRTHVRNMLGNAMMRRVIQAKNVVGAGIESIAISDQSQRTKAVLTSNDTALKDYANSTWDFVKHEFEGSKYSDGEKGFAKAVEGNRTIFKWSALEKLRKLNDAGLTFEDSWAAKKLYTSTFAQVMKARGLTADTITEAQKKEIAGIAINEAIKGTFHDANQFAKTMSKWENGSLFGKVFIGGTLPFKNTPINIAKRGVEYSPLGLIKTVFNDFPKVKKGEMSAAQAIDGIASGFVGTSLFAIGAFLAKAGILRGEGEDSDKEEYYRRDLGDQPYAIYIGDKSYTIDWLSPAAMPLFMGVEFYKILSGESDSDNAFDAVLSFASQLTNPLLQLSFLEGVNDTLTAAQESEYGMIVGAIANAPGNYLSQFIPTLSGQIARTIDPVRRNTKGDPTAEMGQEVDEYLNKIKAKIPFLSSTLPAYVNAWGEEEVDDSHWAMRLIKNAISPGYSDERNYSDVDEEILRLFEATNSENILPNYYYTYRDLVRKGENYTLTNEEWTEFRKDWGMALYEAAEDAMNSSAYIAMTDDEKAKYLSDAMKSARDDIADEYKDKYLGK